jgi:hypothetical protein
METNLLPTPSSANGKAIARKPRFGFRAHQVFWNERGAIACACCGIPHPGSDTWVWERWQEITPEIMVEIDREGGRVACEGCGKEPTTANAATR